MTLNSCCFLLWDVQQSPNNHPKGSVTKPMQKVCHALSFDTPASRLSHLRVVKALPSISTGCVLLILPYTKHFDGLCFLFLPSSYCFYYIYSIFACDDISQTTYWNIRYWLYCSIFSSCCKILGILLNTQYVDILLQLDCTMLSI